jgi:hypothetical protein
MKFILFEKLLLRHSMEVCLSFQSLSFFLLFVEDFHSFVCSFVCSFFLLFVEDFRSFVVKDFC